MNDTTHREQTGTASNLASPAHWKSWWTAGFRTTTLRSLGALPASVGPWTLAIVLLLASAATVLAERLAYDVPLTFSPQGWIWGWIHLLFPLALVWWAFSFGFRDTTHRQPVAAWVLLSQFALLFPALAVRAWGLLGQYDWLPEASRSRTMGWIVFGICMLWVLLAFWRITQSLHRHRLMHALLPLAATGLIALQSFWLNTSAWEAEEGTESPRPVLSLSQEVFLQQEQLLEDALSSIQAQASDDVRVFGLVYAPYAQDVFQRESEMVAAQFANRLDAKGRVVQLLNHAGATQQRPWATPLNLRRAIQAVADRMNLNRDILVLYLTSHGGKDHRLASSHWPLDVNDLTAAELRRMLDEAGIRYRAVAVSACYSGGWVDPLKGDHTLIMTAADKDHTSYGCGSKSDLTYFGKAVFQEQLQHTDSLEAAFAAAVPLIRTREIESGKDDGFSNPQIAVGEAFRAQWSLWRNRSGTVATR